MLSQTFPPLKALKITKLLHVKLCERFCVRRKKKLNNNFCKYKYSNARLGKERFCKYSRFLCVGKYFLIEFQLPNCCITLAFMRNSSNGIYLYRYKVDFHQKLCGNSNGTKRLSCIWALFFPFSMPSISSKRAFPLCMKLSLLHLLTFHSWVPHTDE